MKASASIFNVFGRSPIRPLEEHMAKVHACAEQLEPFFQKVLLQQWEEAKKLQEKIVRLENEAEVLKRELRLHLPKGLFLPVPRGDLLALLTTQDRIANLAKDIAGIVVGRYMILPNFISMQYLTFLNRCIDVSKQANTAIHELDELMEAGFSDKEVKIIDNMITTLGAIENETDDMQIALRDVLFKQESKFPPIDIIFLYKIIEWTGELANCAQEVGDRLQILLAR